MTIKEIYNELSSKSLKLSNFNEIINLKNKCKLEMNNEYLYLSDILIIDLYINEGLFDDALVIANKMINNIDNIIFQKIYISLLERFIYIYIQKRNYKSAYRYAFMKRNFIDLENIDEVNRWYLEMSYIYAELNQKDKALLNLKAILSNYPNESLKALTLSNLTKLYIDQEQIENAKQTLNDCITLVYKLNDEEGILYCNYLNAKLYILENNLKLAKQSFQDLFKNLHTLSSDYLYIVNEYVSLLIDMDLYDEANRLCIKYLKNFEQSNDLEIKKNYYNNYLKILILRNKNTRDDIRNLLKNIDLLTNEISKNESLVTNESSEDEKRIEVDTELRNLINKVEKTLNIVTTSIKNDNKRSCLLEYSKQLENHLQFDEATYVILSRSEFEVVATTLESLNKVYTYSYKKERLYEREISFNNLTGSVVEMLINQNHELIIDLTDSVIDVKDLITQKSYLDNDIKSIIAIPLFNKGELFGCAIYLSKSDSLIGFDIMTNLKIASKILESKLINLYTEESTRSLRLLNKYNANHIHEGSLIYYPNEKTFVLKEKLQKFFQFTSSNVLLEDFNKLIVLDDLIIRSNIELLIENGEEYNIEYRVLINDQEYLIRETGYPYITRDGIIKYYYIIIETINTISVEKNVFKILNLEDYENKKLEIEENAKKSNYKYGFIKFRIDNDQVHPQNIIMKIGEYVYSIIYKYFPKQTYFVNNEYIVINENYDNKGLEKQIRSIITKIKEGIVIDDNWYSISVNAGIVRFPRDTYNLNEIEQYLDLTLSRKNEIQFFNEDIHKLYLQKKNVHSCINEHLRKKEIELLYVKLESYDLTESYFVEYNVKGINDKEVIYNHLDLKTKIGFEKLIFNTLLSKELKNKVYISLSNETLVSLLSEQSFKSQNPDVYKNIVINVRDYNETTKEELRKINNLGFRFVLDYQELHSIDFISLINSKIFTGIFVGKNITLDINLLNILDILEFVVISKNRELKYKKHIIITDKNINL